MEISIKKNKVEIYRRIEFDEKTKWKLKYKSLKDMNLELKKWTYKLRKKLFFKHVIPEVLLNFFISKPELLIDLLEKNMESVRKVYMTLLTINIEVCKELAILESISTSHDRELNHQKNSLVTEYLKRKKLINRQILLATDNLNKLEKFIKRLNS